MKLSPELHAEAVKMAQDHPEDIVAVYAIVSSSCVFASPSHETILGYTTTEMLGKSWQTFVAPEDHAHAALAGADAMLMGNSIEFGFLGLTKSGERVAMRGSARIRTNPGTLTPFLFFRAHRHDRATHK